MSIDPFYIIRFILPSIILVLVICYAYSCWGKHLRGEGFAGGITFIDSLCFLAVMMVLSSGSEDQLNIMTIVTGGVVVLLSLRAINSLLEVVAARKLRGERLDSQQ
jgi:chromate transport protein ChrA